MNSILNVIMMLSILLFFLSCSLGTTYYNTGAKDIDKIIEDEYNAFVSKNVVNRTQGTPWDEQFVLDIKNASYQILSTVKAIGTKYGYEHPSTIYPWLAFISLPVMYGSYFLYIIQYAIAMIWVGWDKLAGIPSKATGLVNR